MVIEILLCIGWYICGGVGFIFWWSKDHDATTTEIPMILILGILGPFTFILGWFVHGETFKSPPKVLFKKRK